ncbi:hypothetical protein LCGC14_2793470, partial [marine sediment metagenome]
DLHMASRRAPLPDDETLWSHLKGVVVISAGPPKYLAASIIGRLEDRNESKALSKALAYLPDVREQGLGTTILELFRKYPKRSAKLRFWILRASIRAGCTEGLPEAMALLRRAEVMCDASSLLHDLVDEETIQELMKRTGIRDGHRKGAGRLLALLVANRTALQFPEGADKYVVSFGGARAWWKAGKGHPLPVTSAQATTGSSFASENAKIHRWLLTPMPKVAWEGASFKEALSLLTSVSGVTVEARWHVLYAVGVSPSRPVRVDLRGVLVKQAIEEFLRQVAGDAEIGYAVVRGRLVISSSEDLKRGKRN